ncbi:hypothetical protein [Achromobacter sp.]|uniref:hypothetical protein n=1 Tax=Achromobacter sp. TaxID=134375 RepID=UPI00390C9016
MRQATLRQAILRRANPRQAIHSPASSQAPLRQPAPACRRPPPSDSTYPPAHPGPPPGLRARAPGRAWVRRLSSARAAHVARRPPARPAGTAAATGRTRHRTWAASPSGWRS